MKVSFVIPAYNEEVLIGGCITSVLREIARSGVAAEVIVVSNASTDRTEEIALSFPGVTVVQEPIKGLVMARRAGFVVATGDLVANIDADVLIPDGWLTHVVESFTKDDTLVALSGPFKYYDLSPVVQLLVKVFYFIAQCSALVNGHIFGTGAILQGGNFVIKREVFAQVGGFDTTISFYGEDTDVARRLMRAGRVRWTFGLPVYASGRRLRKEGVVTMSIRYTLNHIWMSFFGRPFTKQYIDIRPVSSQNK